MESDISEPKSRSFNLFLRFFQLGLSLTAAAVISQLLSSSCIDDTFKLMALLSMVMVVFNFIAMVSLRCSVNFPKCGFIMAYIIDIGLSAAIVLLALRDYQTSQNCAFSALLFRFFIVEIGLYVIMSFLILVLPFHWIQRYSNSPGNWVWPGLFFSFLWSFLDASATHSLLLIGLLTFLVSVITLAGNLIAGCKGITTGMKRCLIVCWVMTVLLMVGAEVLAVLTYISIKEGSDYQGMVAKILLEIFVAINLIDLNFWLFGLLTLRHENGDNIRDDLVKFGRDSKFEEDSSKVYKYEGDSQ
jgi:hypothetical protein